MHDEVVGSTAERSLVVRGLTTREVQSHLPGPLPSSTASNIARPPPLSAFRISRVFISLLQ